MQEPNKSSPKKFLMERMPLQYTCTSASGRDSKIIKRTPKGEDIFSKINPCESWI